VFLIDPNIFYAKKKIDGQNPEIRKNPDLPILILKTMQSETHLFFFGLINQIGEIFLMQG
jgi:hypothetical protein